MRRLLLATSAALTLTACQSVDAGADAASLHQDLQERAGAALPAPPRDPSSAVDEAVLALLRTPLDDAAAVRVALLNNHRARALHDRLGIARADLVQAGLLRNPTFDGDARFLLEGGTELELGLAQPFVDLFHRPLRERLAEHEFTAAKALLTDELVRLVFAVRRATVHARAATRLVDLQRDALVAAAAAHELAVALHAAGNLTDQALAMERAGETRARLDLAAAELAATEAREPLQRLLGLWGAHTEWTLAGTLDDDPLQGCDLARIESRAIARSLALATHRARLDALAQQIGLRSWQQWLPDGSFGVTALREPGGDWGLGPQLGLELPLFDSGRTARTRAEHQLQAGLHEQVQLAVEIRSAARTLRERTALLAEQARFLREVHLPQRAAVLRTTVQNYNAMQIGVFDVLAQRRQQLQDQREYVTTLRDAHLARLDLQALLAGSLPATATAPYTASPPTATDHTTTERGHE